MKLHEGLHIATFQDGRVEVCSGMETMLRFDSISTKLCELLKQIARGASRPDLFHRAQSLGVPHTQLEELLLELKHADLVSSRTTRRSKSPDESTWRRMGGEAMAKTYRHRSHYCVSINSGARMGRLLAAELAAAGVGNLRIPSPEKSSGSGRATPAWGEAAEAILSGRNLPTGSNARSKPDLKILLSWGVPKPLETLAAMSADQVNLPVVVGHDFVEIGPLVVPGLTPCVSCVMHHRETLAPDMIERAAWLSAVKFPPTETCLASFGAAFAAAYTLAFLDRRALFPGQVTRVDTEGAVETLRYDWHPECGCNAIPGI